MKKILLPALAIFSVLLVRAQSKKIYPSTQIREVTVYLQGAQVNRTAAITLPSGKSEIVFSNLSPLMETQSIQAKAGTGITILSVSHRMNYLHEQEIQSEISSLMQQQQELTDKINVEKNMLSVYKQEETMLIKNQDIKGNQTGLKASDLKEAIEFQTSRLTDLYNKMAERQRNIQKLESENSKISRQLVELNQKKDLSTSEINVMVSTAQAGNYNFEIGYLVKKAGWYPTYDIRVSNISSPVLLRHRANIYQQSGEDWKDVKLFLSTGNPSDNSTRPVLQPWFLRFGNPSQFSYLRGDSLSRLFPGYGTLTGIIRNEDGIPLAGAALVIKGTRTATTSNNQGFFSIPLPPGAQTIQVSSVGFNSLEVPATGGYLDIRLKENTQSLSEVVVTGYGISGKAAGVDLSENDQRIRRRKEENEPGIITRFQPTSILYEVKDPFTLGKDGKVNMVEVESLELDALYEYSAVPKRDPSAYLTARIPDWQDLNLLPGETSLYFEGRFLGKSFLDVFDAGDTLAISLGPDKGVVIKRTLLKDYNRKKLLGSSQTISRQYEITVRNNKQEPVHIIIEDQFPISTTRDMEIMNKESGDGEVESSTQLVRWSLSVAPANDKKCLLSYSVKYPKDRALALE